MIIDGKALAQKILSQIEEAVSRAQRSPHLTIVTVTPNFVTQTYLASKKNSAKKVGIAVNIIECAANSTTEDLKEIVARAAEHTDGIVVQLPLPTTVDTAAVLASIPKEKDVDAFRYAKEGGELLPPVTGAIAAIATQHKLSFTGKKAAVIGRGRLVGEPAAYFLSAAGAMVTVIDKETVPAQVASTLAQADVIVSGAGVPHMIQSADVKEGVVIFDAGTSEDSGRLAGDVDPKVAQKASIFTPVPGGIGPLTIACLLQNVLQLSRLRG